MKKLIVVIVCCILAMVMVGCNNPENEIYSSTSFGVVERCPVRVDIRVDGDGRVDSVRFSEYFSVYDIGKLTLADGKWYKCEVEIDEHENGYAKYVRVGETTFVMDGGEYDFVYEEQEISYDEWLSRDVEQYVNALKSEQYDIVNKDGQSYGVSFDVFNGRKVTKAEWGDKLKNGYHEGKNYEYGYKENIYRLITHLKNHGFYAYTGDEKPSGKQGTFVVGKYDTLVNLSGFHGYMQIALTAYNTAKESKVN